MTILDRIRALGLEFNLEQIQRSIQLLAPFAPKPDEARVLRDAAFGPDERHRLDLFLPAPGVTEAPVLLFIHGGGFTGGDKGDAHAPFYNNLGAWGQARGWLTATATYRLAPAHRWPAAAEDVAAAVRWLRANAVAHGGDPDRIVLLGQSAGAAHVATVVGHPRFRAEAEAALAGAAMMSGIYDVTRGPRREGALAYYGPHADDGEDPSPLPGLAATPLPCLFSIAEHDPDFMHGQLLWVMEAWIAAKGTWPDFHRHRGHNHVTPVFQLGAADDTFGPELAEFVERVRREG